MATFETITTPDQKVKLVISELKFSSLDTDAGSEMDLGRGKLYAKLIGRLVNSDNSPILNNEGDKTYSNIAKTINADLMTEIGNPSNTFEINGKNINASDVLEWFVKWTDNKLVKQ